VILLDSDDERSVPTIGVADIGIGVISPQQLSHSVVSTIEGCHQQSSVGSFRLRHQGVETWAGAEEAGGHGAVLEHQSAPPGSPGAAGDQWSGSEVMGQRSE